MHTLYINFQVAAEIDERPALMTGKWKTMAGSRASNESPNKSHMSRKSKYISQNISNDEDFSPPRRKRHDSSSENEQNPPKRRYDSSNDDNSSRIKKRHDSSSDDNNQKNKSINSDSDASPRQKVLSNNHSDSDFSPPRQSRAKNTSTMQEDSDNSPPRSKHKKKQSDSDNSPPRARPNRKQSDSDNSPPRAKNNSPLAKKTLDGKKAGLQNASSLKSEMDKSRGEEKRRLDALSSEISDKGAKTMVRGRLKEKQAEEERKKAKVEISEAVKEKYTRWSKG